MNYLALGALIIGVLFLIGLPVGLLLRLIYWKRRALVAERELHFRGIYVDLMGVVRRNVQ